MGAPPSGDWDAFYRAREGSAHSRRFAEKYEPFLRLLRAHAPRAADIAEFGCGTGIVSRTLLDGRSEVRARHVLYDNDSRMLANAKRRLRGARRGGAIEFSLSDIRADLPRRRFDLIHSHGVLEHFDGDEARLIVRNQLSRLKRGGWLIQYVPSWKYVIPSFGDERLRSASDWTAICAPDRIVEFNDGFDFILVWRRG